MMAFCPEHPKWDQNPKFTPLSETTSIPTPFICGVPPGALYKFWTTVARWFVALRIYYQLQTSAKTSDTGFLLNKNETLGLNEENCWILMPKKPSCRHHIGVKYTSEKLELSMVVLPCFRTWRAKLYQTVSEMGFPGCGDFPHVKLRIRNFKAKRGRDSGLKEYGDTGFRK